VSATDVRVAGLDGCRAGWVLATGRVTSARRAGAMLRDVEVAVVATFADALARVLDGSIAAMGVDMPIGLQDSGSRRADQDARRRLGPRRSSVFPTPVRAALHAPDYPEALARSRAIDGRGLSKQAFHLLPRMAEVDAAMTPELQGRVFECHPETVFARLGEGPLTLTKHTPEGLDLRQELLQPWFAEDVGSHLPAPVGAKADDVLDALAVAVTAWRFTDGDVEHLGDGALDARGLRMEIVV
jgi:predicted RNase H-like nuclease